MSRAQAFDIDFGGPSKPMTRPPPRLSSAQPNIGTPIRSKPLGAASSTTTSRVTRPSPLAPRKEFVKGQQVKIKNPTGVAGYSDGEIWQKNVDGSYDVEYSDGRIEKKVLASRIALPPSANSDSDGESKKMTPSASATSTSGLNSTSFRVGAKVECKMKGSMDRWMGGTIVSLNKDGSFDVRLENGEESLKVPEYNLRPRGGVSSSASSINTPSRDREFGSASATRKSLAAADSDSDTGGQGPLPIGDAVEARRDGNIRWCHATVTNKRIGDTYDLEYTDGGRELRVKRELIRKAPKSNTGGLSRSPVRQSAARITVGAKVEGNYRGKGKWYPGKVKQVRMDGTFDVDYDDGEQETRLSPDLVRLVGGAMARSVSPPIKQRITVGANVEGNYRGKGKWYPGKVKQVRMDGTFDVDYDDGEQETHLSPDLVRLVGGSAVSNSPVRKARIEEGSKVEANYRGKGKWYPGKVKQIRSDGTMDINFDDGESETRVEPDMVRLVGGGAVARSISPPIKQRITVGAKVEGNYRGKGKWYPGKVKQVRMDGTFDVDYDDGEQETRLSPDLVRLVGGSAVGNSPVRKARIEEGSKVEGNYRGKGKWYPGKVKQVRSDGTMDINYDDGESETRVEPDMVRLVGGGAGRSVSPPIKQRITVGAKVEGNYRGKGKWYPGKVKQVRMDGTFDVDYDDGEQETRLSPDLVRLVGGSAVGNSPVRKARIEEGSKVEGNYRGKGKWYPGKVKQVRSDGTMDINYDDGESETRVEPDMVRLVGGAVARSVSPPIKQRITVGAKVEGNYRGKGKWYPGAIKQVRLDGTFDIDYDDGEQETRVGADCVRLVGGGSGGRRSPRASRARIEEGSKVEANYRGKGKWYPGKVKQIRSDGTMDVNYDDGESETRVEPDMVRLVGGGAGRSVSPPIKQRITVGAKVEGNYRGKGKWYPGKVKQVRMDGTFDVDYDDGEQETRLSPDLVRLVGGSAVGNSPVRKARIEEGSKVEANYRGKGKWYPGKVKQVRSDGTMDVNYDDGESETRVEPDMVRLVGGALARSVSPPIKQRITVGAKVEGNYRGKGKWYPGKVKQVRMDGTFDVDYDDGEQETRLSPDLVRLVGGSAVGNSPVRKARIEEGSKVEANYRGKGKWYPGRVKQIRSDGTMDINYDDGESETRVEPDMVRLVGGALARSVSPPIKQRITVGAKVEGNYRGKGKWYPGAIKQVRLDGTFDIDYDDGEQETRVGADCVRLVGGGSGGSRSPRASRARIEEGSKVEANYRGKGKWYPGKVKQVRSDGTMDVNYDDGESETRVEPDMVRLVGGGAGRSVSPPIKQRITVGAKVEGNYRGKGKWYPGKVKQVRMDGTFDVDYDDGEQETRLSPDLVRLVGGSAVGNSPVRKARIEEGSKVEANYRGKGKWFPGRVKQIRSDGTMDINYDDGESETRVEPDMVRLVGGVVARSVSPPIKQRITVGAKVEGNYRGKGKWYPGAIKQVRLDGTFDIDYDDGEQETRVGADCVRLVGGGSGGSRSPRASRARIEEGSKVEANYRGKGKWYPGRVKQIRSDGTMDVNYDDGESETRVEPDMVRLVGGAVARSISPPIKQRITVGAKVEGNYRGKGKWYPGKVKQVRIDGTFDVDYDDGEQETRLSPDLVRLVGGSALSNSPVRKARIEEGSKVEANYRGKGKWYPGRVKQIRSDGTMDVNYDDGESETRVEPDMVRLVGGADARSISPPIKQRITVGAKVEGNYRGKGKWYPGKVKQVRMDGTFDVDYDDGEQETRVGADCVRLVGSGSGGSRSPRASRARIEEGSKVEANYRGKGKWYPGRVKQIRSDGTMDINYDDGESETRVEPDMVRLVGGAVARSISPPIKQRITVGAKVEGNYRGKGKWYPGKVKQVRMDGTFDVDYDDGEQETRLSPDLVRLVGGSAVGNSPVRKARIEEGSKVEANYRGRGKWFPGRVKQIRSDGTMDINYDDGESETRVEPDMVRLVGSAVGRSVSPPIKQRITVGAKVEGNYRGKGKWFPGKVSRVRSDGTFDIDYDDGEQETRVESDLIRLVGGGSGGSRSPRASRARIEEGSKVEANYRGKGKWYPGKVKQIRSDGTMDINYDDGESETRVEPDMVRLVGGASVRNSRSPPRKVRIEEGSKVEANYRGKGKWFSGMVSRVRSDGTFDINYDDGESETRVEPDMVRLVGGASVRISRSPPRKARIEEGSKVEANYRGKGKWYPGKVKQVRSDGTMDVNYDDGESETRVEPDMVRLVGGGAGRSVSPPIKQRITVGAKVEGNYRGKGKWYPGKVSRVRSDGTFDIDYDDGEQETRVESDLIRLIGGGSGGSRSPRASRARIEEGSKVEGNYRGKGKWYPGKVKQVRSDGTMDINYDDGESETRVEPDMVRLVGGGAGRSVSPARKSTIEEGSKVEGNYRGKGKWYPGRVSRARLDGTFDIDYDDGEQETRVEADLIRPITSSGGVSRSSDRDRLKSATSGGRDSRDAPAYSVDDKIEADYRGKGRYFPGVISRDHRDGTYDIEYDDGEREKAVDFSLIRPLGRDRTGASGGKMTSSKTVLVSAALKKSIQSVCSKYNSKSSDSSCRKVFEEYVDKDEVQRKSKAVPDGFSHYTLVTRKEFRSALKKIYMDSLSRQESRAGDVTDWLTDEDQDCLADCCAYTDTTSKTGITMVNYNAFLAFAQDPPLSDSNASSGRDRDGVRESRDRSSVRDRDSVELSLSSLMDIHEKLRKEAFLAHKYKYKDIDKLFSSCRNYAQGYVRSSEFDTVVSNKICKKILPSEVKQLSALFDQGAEGVVDFHMFIYWLMLGNANFVLDLSARVRSMCNDLLMQRGHVAEILEKNAGRNDTLKLSDFVQAASALGLVLSQSEVAVLFNTIDAKQANSLTVKDIVDWLAASDKGGKKSSRKLSADKLDNSTQLISRDLKEDLADKVNAFLKAAQSGGKDRNRASRDRDRDRDRNAGGSLGKLLLSHCDSNSLLTKKKFRAVLEALDGDSLKERDETLLFEALSDSVANSVHNEDLLLYLYSFVHDSDSVEARQVIHETFEKKRITGRELYKLLLKQDVDNTGFCESSNFQKVMVKSCGSAASPDAVDDMLRFLDPNKEGDVDIAYASAIVNVCSGGSTAIGRIENKLRHTLKVMNMRGLNYSKEITSLVKEHCGGGTARRDDDKDTRRSRDSIGDMVVSVDDFVALMGSFSIPMLPCELELLGNKHAEKKRSGDESEARVDIQKLLEAMENDPVSASHGATNLATSLLNKFSSGNKDSTGSNNNFGKGLFKKLYKLRSNESAREKFRRALFDKDSELVGNIALKDFERIVDNNLELTEPESGLLAENLAFTDGYHQRDIDYSYLLLLLYEPIQTASGNNASIITIGITLMKHMMRSGTDLVSLRRLLSLLFRNCAATDTRASGKVSVKEVLKAVKDECRGVDHKTLSTLVKSFTDSGDRRDRDKDRENEQNVNYPELLAYLGCCAITNVLNKLQYIERIRSQQGYNLKGILTKYTAKRGNKLTIDKFTELMHNLGIVLTDTAIAVIFQFYANNKNGLLDVEAFYNGILTNESLEGNDGGPGASYTRKDISPLLLEAGRSSASQLDEISVQILTEYDEKLVRAVQIAFDIVDKHRTNSVASSEIERIFCSIGYHKVDMVEFAMLIGKIDSRNTGFLQYNDFMAVVIPYLRELYSQASMLSIHKLKYLFDKFDVSGDGILQPYELRHILTLICKQVREEEVEALIKYLDVDDDGDISWSEFKRVYDILATDHDVRQGGETSRLIETELDSLDYNMRSALRKIQYSGLPDPYEYLTLYIGLPTNYRLSVLSELEKTNPSNGMKNVVCRQYRHQKQQVASPVTTVNNVNGTSVATNNDLQFEVQVVRVTGVPSEDLIRRDDVVSRGVKFAICQTNAPPTVDATEGANATPGNPPDFLGNVTQLHATIHQSYLDKWQFANKEEFDSDKSCFVHCHAQKSYVDNNLTTGPDGTVNNTNIANNPNDELYLFVELVVSIRLSRDKYKITNKGIKYKKKYKQLVLQQQQQDLAEANAKQSLLASSTNKPLVNAPPNQPNNVGATPLEPPKSFMDSFLRSSNNNPTKPPEGKKGTLMDTKFFNKTDASSKSNKKSGGKKGGDGSDDSEEEKEADGSDSDDSSSDDDDLLERHPNDMSSDEEGSGSDGNDSRDRDGKNKKRRSKRSKKQMKADKLNRNALVVDMCCGWTMIPITACLKNRATKQRFTMYGGTPFSALRINDKEVKIRNGAWQSIKRAFGFNVKSILEILISPIIPTVRSAFSSVPRTIATNTAAGSAANTANAVAQVIDQYLTTILPPNIVVPSSSVTIVGIYRKQLMTALNPTHLIYDDVTERILPQTGSLHHADAVLSSFPKLLADPAAVRVLLLLWKKEFGTSTTDIVGSKTYKDWTVTDASHKRALEVFRSVVLQLWHAYSSPHAQPDKLNPLETAEAITKREQYMLRVVGLVKTAGNNTGNFVVGGTVQQQAGQTANGRPASANLTGIANSNNGASTKTAAPAKRPLSMSMSFGGSRPPLQQQNQNPNNPVDPKQAQDATIIGGVVVTSQQASKVPTTSLAAANNQTSNAYEEHADQLYTPFHSRELLWNGRQLDLR